MFEHSRIDIEKTDPLRIFMGWGAYELSVPVDLIGKQDLELRSLHYICAMPKGEQFEGFSTHSRFECRLVPSKCLAMVRNEEHHRIIQSARLTQIRNDGSKLVIRPRQRFQITLEDTLFRIVAEPALSFFLATYIGIRPVWFTEMHHHEGRHIRLEACDPPLDFMHKIGAEVRSTQSPVGKNVRKERPGERDLSDHIQNRQVR
ncbi:hypothetical protein D9M71_481110 [compost metagenome]